MEVLTTETERYKRRINGAVVVNQYQIQSYVLTTAKYDFSPYEKRLLYLLVQLAREYYQEETSELKFPRDCKKLISVKGRDLVEVTIPLASMLAHDGDKNYSCVKKALKNLASNPDYYYTEAYIIGQDEGPDGMIVVAWCVNYSEAQCFLTYEPDYLDEDYPYLLTMYSNGTEDILDDEIVVIWQAIR